MENGQEFVDYYKVLQVDWDCSHRTLELAYHHLAKMYHPDNAETSDVERFSEAVEAYNALRDPDKREDYDRIYLATIGRPAYRFAPDDGPAVDEMTAAGDAEIHAKLLLILYKRRRERPSDPGIGGWLIQEMLACTDDQFEFHNWYLRSKGLVEITEQGTLAISIAGVDHVISTSRATLREKLRIAHEEAS
jgi:curved DNA-binding protein